LPSAVHVDPQPVPDGVAAQAPPAPHTPFDVQTSPFVGAHRASEVPAATGAHAPVEQLWQVPQDALAQQVPPTHWPFAHSAPETHGEPFTFGSPQMNALPLLTQAASPKQSCARVAVVQLLLHVFRVASHRKLPQLTLAPAGQAPPAPSHVAALVPAFVPAGQLAGRHTVAADQNWHAPAPLHRPFVPQVEASVAVQPPSVSATPAGTFEHVPSEPARAHV
jgi:hypothetical protein